MHIKKENNDLFMIILAVTRELFLGSLANADILLINPLRARRGQERGKEWKQREQGSPPDCG